MNESFIMSFETAFVIALATILVGVFVITKQMLSSGKDDKRKHR